MRKFPMLAKLAAGTSLCITLAVACFAQAQEQDAIKPVPILTGSTAYFTQISGGEASNTPSVTPLLLVPVGDRWLIEAKSFYSDSFGHDSAGTYGGTASYGLAYAQLDYIASRYVTLTTGRFLTPFGIYNERLTPNWIRALQTTAIINGVTSDSALGGMLRGGFTLVPEKVNFTYAAYFSAANTNHILATDRTTGGRLSFFFPQHRLEIGASFQKLLQENHARAFGMHAEWQPERLPLTLRSEYVHQSGTYGAGYWVESVYRLSQIHHLQRLELAARGQQFFAAKNLTPDEIADVGPLAMDTTEADGGLNYYFSRDVRGSASYGRQFVPGQNSNIWVVGLTYRFLVPLGRGGQ